MSAVSSSFSDSYEPWARRLVRYVERFEPGFAASVAPARDQEVDRLEATVGRTLVDEYRDFLLVLGSSDGGLFRPDSLTTAVSSVQSLVEIYHDDCGSGFFESYELFAMSAQDDGVGLVLKDRRAAEVVVLEGCGPAAGWSTLASSLPAYAFSAAFFREMKKVSKRHHGLTVPAGKYTTMVDALLHTKFEPEFFADHMNWFGRCEHVMISATRVLGSGDVALWVVAPNDGEARSVAMNVSRELACGTPSEVDAP